MEFEIKRTLEVEVFNKKGFAIIYGRYADEPKTFVWYVCPEKEATNLVTRRMKIKDITSLGGLRGKFRPSHFDKTQKYDAYACFMTPEMIDRLGTEGFTNDVSHAMEKHIWEPKEFGELPGDEFEPAFTCWADHTIYDVNKRNIPVAIGDFILARDYDFKVVHESAANNDRLAVVGKEYYVPGNGTSLNIRIRLDYDDYMKWLTDKRNNWRKVKFAAEIAGINLGEIPEDDRVSDDDGW